MLGAGHAPRRAPLAASATRPGCTPAPSKAARPLPASKTTPLAVGSSTVVPAIR